MPPPSPLPLVAIIGRANVGKSTLFNSLTRSAQALVDDAPGVTRDRHYGRVISEEHAFLLVDTGGLVGGEDELGRLVRRQAQVAVAEADAVLLVMDGKVGPQPGDDEVVDYLRSKGKPLLLVVNKIDHPGREEHLSEFYRFGLAPLYPVSAAHRLGLGNLLAALRNILPPPSEAAVPPHGLRVAVIGRPNVGKSSFINRVMGEERLIVSPQPGTTRDAIDTPLTWQGRDYLFIDTAGLRRRSLIAPGLEKYMVLKAIKALERAAVALLLLDAREGVTLQDLRLAGLVADKGKGCVIGLNKWDLLPKEAAAGKRILEAVSAALDFMPHVPVAPLSVLTGYNLSRIFALLDEVYAQSGRRVGTGELNQLCQDILRRTPPPLYRGRPVKLFFVTQADIHPPTFVAVVNHPQAIPESYRRYLVKQLRAGLDLPHAPLRLFLKKRRRRQ